MPPGLIAAYQVRLDDSGDLIYAPEDVDEIIRKIGKFINLSLLRSRPKFPSLTRETKTIIYILLLRTGTKTSEKRTYAQKTPPHAREQRKKRTNGKQKHKTRNN